MSVRVALVRGPMYDHLYEMLTDGPVDVEVVVHEDHPTLNRRVAEILSAGGTLDLISTHGKYAPSQAQWLRPLDDMIDEQTISGLAPLAVDLCRADGRLWCVPRLIDVRVMWVRSDRVDTVPDTWSELVEQDTVFGFPGRESGLFGTFFELVVGAGGQLFDGEGRPTIASREAVTAVELLRELASRAPADLVEWHYDDVDRALLDGRVDAAAAWPGAWGPISRSTVGDRLVPHPYPSGAARRVSYSGCHAWAIPRSATDVDGALALLHLLSGQRAHARDAAGGNICANVAALAAVQPTSAIDERRLAITRQTIAESMITYPPLTHFPEIEDAGWQAIREALRDATSSTHAVERVQAVAEAALRRERPAGAT
jgi:multiple sugar transport system substrate-binding protein